MRNIIRKSQFLKKIIKAVLFCLGFAVICVSVLSIFRVVFYSGLSRERLLRSEPPDSLDAVYIGSSNAYDFFIPPLAWEEYGFAVGLYAIPSMPACSIKYRIIEARKTQKDALFIININNFATEEVKTQAIHFNVDFMPWSVNKIRMLQAMLAEGGFGFFDSAEYFFPFIRFHSRWSELRHSDFVYEPNTMKGAVSASTFLNKITDFSKASQYPGEIAPMSDIQRNTLEDLLDYVEKENISVLFVSVPQFLDRETVGQLNDIRDFVAEKGYPCLDLISGNDILGTQPATDFFNKLHTNIHGAIKFTRYISGYIKEHYEFTDKREHPEYESWNAAAGEFNEMASRWTLDFERDPFAQRDFELSAPASFKADLKEGSSVMLSWKGPEDADAFCVYRKTGRAENRNWRLVAEIPADETSFFDHETENNTSYTYTVVPVRIENGVKFYGNFNVSGKNVKIGNITIEEENDEFTGPDEEI